MSNRREARQRSKQENKITKVLPYSDVSYTNPKRVLTREQERRIEREIMNMSPFKEMAEALKDSPYRL